MKYFFFFTFLTILFSCSEDEITAENNEHVFSTKKVVVGYQPSYRDNTVQWSKITHLIYAFIYPKSDGTLDTNEMSQLTSFVTLAHQNNTKILVSIGGASYPGADSRVFTSIIKDDTKRTALVQNIKSFVINNNLDGIDIDYEELVGGGSDVDNNETNKLIDLYKELRNTLPYDKLITAAVTGGSNWAAYHFRDIATEMSNILDFISIMSYDNTGTWDASPLGAHSSLDDAKSAMNKYLEFGASKKKLVLGIPFYGRDFLTETGGLATAVTYADILTNFSPSDTELLEGNINRDGHNIYFNSQGIIAQKVTYVKNQDFKGITIWELGQDTDIENLSLLKNILNQF